MQTLSFLGRVKLFKTPPKPSGDAFKKIDKDIEKQINNKIRCPRCDKRAK